jgi:Na+-translocating ferredoxin:NAD+ oxidoreductase RnfD subunit
VTGRLRTLPLDKHLTSDCKKRDFLSACVYSQFSVGERLQSSRLSLLLAGEFNLGSRSCVAKTSASMIQFTIFTRATSWSSCSPKNIAVPSVQMPIHFAQEISSAVKHSVLSSKVSEICKQNVNFTWMFSSK